MLRVGISGYQIWYHSIVFAEELQKSSTMKVVSVFDENPVFSKRLGEAAGGATVFTDIDKFIESGLDMVIMAGLPSTKLAEIRKYAASKIHVLIDKPVATTSADALKSLMYAIKLKSKQWLDITCIMRRLCGRLRRFYRKANWGAQYMHSLPMMGQCYKKLSGVQNLAGSWIQKRT